MNGILTTFSIFTTSVLLGGTLAAAEPTMQSLETRISTLETRIKELEGSLKGRQNGYSYQDAATVEATNGVSASAPAPAAGATTSGQTYTIQDGDTLGKIAGKFGIERKTLLEANRLSEGQPIYIGETLLIPGSAAPVAADKIAPPAIPDSNKLADKTPTAPAPAAPATPPVAPAKQDSKVIGDTKAPAPATTSTHTVAKGDTLTSLAKKYNTSVDSLKSANGLRSDTISLGQTLKIPTAKTASTTKPEVKTEQASKTEKPKQDSAFEYDNPLLNKSETYGYYTVEKGDNLYALARDFFTNMAELQRINNLGSSTLIQPGQDIIVPTSKYNEYHKEEVANR